MYTWIPSLFIFFSAISLGAIGPSSTQSILDIAKERESSREHLVGQKKKLPQFCRVMKPGIPIVQIDSVAGLQAIKSGGNYVLTKDLALPYGFLPLGETDEPIVDITLDGRGHTIKGLNQPLFSAISSSTVRNLELVDVYIGGDNTFGGAVANRVGSNSCFENVRVSEGWIQASGNLGGVFGTVTGANIALSNISSSLEIKARSGMGDSFGGIIGRLEAAGLGRVYLSELKGKSQITAPDSNKVGGLIGTLLISSEQVMVEFADSEYRGVVKGSSRVGGLVGSVESTGKANLFIERNYVQAHVTGNTLEDPAVAEFSTASSYVGGLVGDLNVGKVSRCFTQGYVSGLTLVGGFVGGSSSPQCTETHRCSIDSTYSVSQVVPEALEHHAQTLKPQNVGAYAGAKIPFTVSESYWDKSISGTVVSAAGIAKTTGDFKKLQAFQNSYWHFEESDVYPKLAGR